MWPVYFLKKKTECGRLRSIVGSKMRISNRDIKSDDDIRIRNRATSWDAPTGAALHAVCMQLPKTGGACGLALSVNRGIKALKNYGPLESLGGKSPGHSCILLTSADDDADTATTPAGNRIM